MKTFQKILVVVLAITMMSMFLKLINSDDNDVPNIPVDSIEISEEILIF